MNKPSILGGKSIFITSNISIVFPTLPLVANIQEDLEKIFSSGRITNFSSFVQQFENNIKEYLGVKYCLSLPNATTGLMLAGRFMKPGSEVIVPSFTFAPAVNSLLWNRLIPVFADIEPRTFNINPESAEKMITPNTSAILAVHTFGNPCDIEGLERICKKHDLMLIFDSAHAFGSTYHNKKVGSFGDAEIFSLSATKVFTTGEGGLFVTNQEHIAQKILELRNYGITPDLPHFDCRDCGLNGKMIELCAVIGLKNLETIDHFVARRNELADLYRRHLSKLSGITFQEITAGNTSNFKDFAILVDEKLFGLNRDELSSSLDSENIETKKYFYLPVHKMKIYANTGMNYTEMLPHTDFISENVLCLPIYSHMSIEVLEQICFAIERIHNYAAEIKKGLKAS